MSASGDSHHGGRRASRQPIDRALLPFQRFARLEASGAILLLVCTAAALAWANSPWSEGYFALWKTYLTLGAGAFTLSKPLLLWINDGLMAVFFFVVGLEIKREILIGELSSPRRAAFPLVAALGGVVVPVAIYLAINGGTPGERGWGVAMATDIAFALGILALVRGAVALKVFLAALAIADDIAAVLAIAVFYTDRIAWDALAGGALFLLLLFVVGRAGARSPLVYAALGVALWYCFLLSGVHPTAGGVLVAMAVPARSRIDGPEFLARAGEAMETFGRATARREGSVPINREQTASVQELETACEQVQAPLQRMEHALVPWTSFFIIPLFALANAGVRLEADLSALLHPVSLGIVAGLLIGKQVGIPLFAWLAVRVGLAEKPAGITWRQVHGVACIAGIGFTMSLFIANLAFGEGRLLDTSKVGVLAASLLAGLLGAFLLRRAPPPETE